MVQTLIDVVVIGGGAAGLICAGAAANRGKNVVLLEKMERVGRKVLITGKGRCNLTNNCTEEELINSTKTNSKFMYSAFNAFPPDKIMKLVEDMGVPLKTERGNRVFPVSDKSLDVVDALNKYAKTSGVDIRCDAKAASILVEAGKVVGVKTQAGEEIKAKSVVIATGGISYPKTGSTGDGYKFAKQLGHTIIDPRPSLIPIVTDEDDPNQMMGLSLKNVTLTLKNKSKNKAVFSELGEMLFTHFGVSGPLILSASAHMKGNAGDWLLSIDLKPGLSHEQLDARLLRDFSDQQNKDFFNSLNELLPRKMIPIIVRRSNIDGQTKVHQITKQQRLELVNLLKNFTLTPVGFRPIEEAVVTSGGVSCKEINPKTMESKLVAGLFFAGEVIDVDAYTGGFNLQIAFSTGYLAGINA